MTFGQINYYLIFNVFIFHSLITIMSYEYGYALLLYLVSDFGYNIQLINKVIICFSLISFFSYVKVLKLNNIQIFKVCRKWSVNVCPLSV